MQLFNVLEASLAAYLLGSIPTGYLVGKLYGKDLRKEGSGNIGATNVVRVLGKKWGYLVFIVDFLKGSLAVLCAFALAKDSTQREWLALVAAILAILGHNFPIWLKFRGGKGVATTAGVILVLLPRLVFIAAAIVWGLVFFTTRYVSLASLLASIVIPVTCGILYWFGKLSLLFLWISLGICALVIWRHRSNLTRLYAGTESRFIKKNDDKRPS
ncbi:MAG: acyl-phosphate glycerol 3-phosphate acyltransferase [Verrucomicrobia bacterium]|nr:MAG: acyl-phosphate glycerol 3-phosphate acyltransferase [Verrucomicrobiota bacterium]